MHTTTRNTSYMEYIVGVMLDKIWSAKLAFHKKATFKIAIFSRNVSSLCKGESVLF